MPSMVLIDDSSNSLCAPTTLAGAIALKHPSRAAIKLRLERIRECRMHISHIVIRNFRALEEIDCPLGRRINVIVGPNGVGKTTILQALRLSKALLAPRVQNETQQVLVSLGAASPHFPQRVFLNSLARDPSKLIEVRATCELSQSEIATLQLSMPALVQTLVASRAGQAFANPPSKHALCVECAKAHRRLGILFGIY